jgi:hypothetical protein
LTLEEGVTDRRCGRCRKPGHTWKTCQKNPGVKCDVPQAAAEVALRRLTPFVPACSREPNFLQSLMLSCYLQGALDALTPQYREAATALAQEKLR